MIALSLNPCRYELRFQPLAPEGEAFCFPCDARGQVDMDGLSDSDRCEYLYARAMMGRELSPPAVRLNGGR